MKNQIRGYLDLLTCDVTLLIIQVLVSKQGTLLDILKDDPNNK